MGLDMAKEKRENPRLADIRALLTGPSCIWWDQGMLAKINSGAYIVITLRPGFVSLMTPWTFQNCLFLFKKKKENNNNKNNKNCRSLIVVCEQCHRQTSLHQRRVMIRYTTWTNSPANLRMISLSIEFLSGCRGEATVYLCVTLIMLESVSNGDAPG